MPLRQNSDSKETSLEELKQRIHGKLVDKLDLTKVGELEGEILRREIRLVVEHLCDSEDTLLNRSEREQLVSEVLDETFGLGPLELLLKDNTISDIMINGPKNIYCERRGKMEKTQRRLPRQRSPHADHRPHHLQGRPPRGRDLPDGRRPHAGRLAFQRDHSAAGAGRGLRFHPPFRRQSARSWKTC